MYFKRQGYPQDSEIVVCKVTKVQFHSVFVNLEEYGKSGMLHISEVSPGRIRNIRDYVVEGKIVVCKVLKIDEKRVPQDGRFFFSSDNNDVDLRVSTLPATLELGCSIILPFTVSNEPLTVRLLSAEIRPLTVSAETIDIFESK